MDATTDGVDPFLRQFGRETDLTIAPLETRPFFGRHDHERVAPVLGDDDRLMPGLVAQHPERLLKLARGDFGWLHVIISIVDIISKMAIIRKQNIPDGNLCHYVDMN